MKGDKVMPKIQRLSEEDGKLGKALAENAKLDPSIVLRDYNVQSSGDTVTVIFEVFHKMPLAEFEALVASTRTTK